MNTEKITKLSKIREIIRQTLEGVLYLNSKDLVHRDLKPENIMFTDSSKNHVKIIDLGLTVSKKTLINFDRISGTPGFIAPELFQSQEKRIKFLDSKIDIFSLGVTLHFLLFGKGLFRGNTSDELLHSNFNQNFRVKKEGEMITDVKCSRAFDLLSRMIDFNHEKRISVEDALNHEFFCEYTWEF